MSSIQENKFLETEQILLGLEEIYPDLPIIPRTRFAMETLSLSQDPQNREKILNDFDNLVNSVGWVPSFTALKPLLFATTEKEKYLASLRLVSYLFGAESSPFFAETRKNSNGRSLDEFKYFGVLQDLFDEDNPFLRIKKTIDLMADLFGEEIWALKKAYEHYVTLDSALQFYKFLHLATDKILINQIKVLYQTQPEFRLQEAFSKGQIKSKVWARDVLESLDIPPPQKVLVLCGWAGLMDFLLQQSFQCDVINIDQDETVAPIANRINKPARDYGHFESYTINIFDLDLTNLNLSPSIHQDKVHWQKADLVINLSCEHLSDFQSWYESVPDGQLLLLQSNDFFECQEHCNCVNSVAEFREQTPMRQRLFSGALPLEKYTRYMTIGFK